MPRAFSPALPAFDAFPMALWSRLVGQALAAAARRRAAAMASRTASPRCGEAIADHLRANRGIACDAEQIFIVNGAQQAST